MTEEQIQLEKDKIIQDHGREDFYKMVGQRIQEALKIKSGIEEIYGEKDILRETISEMLPLTLKETHIHNTNRERALFEIATDTIF